MPEDDEPDDPDEPDDDPGPQPHSLAFPTRVDPAIEGGCVIDLSH